MHPQIKSKTLISAILCISMIVLAYFFVFPQLNKLKTNRGLLSEAKAESVALDEAKAEADSFLAEFATLKEFKKIADASLPAKDIQLSALLANIDSLAANSGLTLTTLGIRDKDALSVVADRGVDYMDIEIAADGSFAGFKNFLILVETNLRLLDLQGITFQVSEADDIQYNLILRSYYQK